MKKLIATLLATQKINSCNHQINWGIHFYNNTKKLIIIHINFKAASDLSESESIPPLCEYWHDLFDLMDPSDIDVETLEPSASDVDSSPLDTDCSTQTSSLQPHTVSVACRQQNFIYTTEKKWS